MGTLAFVRRSAVGLIGTLLGMCLLVIVARANEVSGHGRVPGIVIHDATETARDYVRELDGDQWLVLPDGSRFELVTSTTDPSITNPGDGSFHAFETAEIEATLASLHYPLTGVSAEIFVLPYPRRGALESAAGPGLILLSPGVRPLSREQQHAELTHELGHVVQYALMPDAEQERWTDYRVLRDIDDPAQFSPQAPHASRPHEIFAEDFRALFGDPLATYTGTVENAAITPPERVAGLRDFLLTLGGSPVSALRVTPNPARAAMRFSAPLALGAPAPWLDVFDLAGRRVVTLAPTALGDRAEWSWDGRDALGRTLSAGTWLARVRGTNGPALRITRLP